MDPELQLQEANRRVSRVTTYGTSLQVQELVLVNQIHQQGCQPPSEPTVIEPGQAVPIGAQRATSASMSLGDLSSTNRANGPLRAWRPKSGGDCRTRQCSCSCHRTSKAGSSFWFLEYTPFTASQCDRKSCDSANYGFTFRLALSQIGLRWATVLQFYINTSPGTFMFRPAFQVERIVPYTSPAFEMARMFREDNLKPDDFRNKFRELERLDPALRRQVNPSGMSLLDVMLCQPSLA